MHSRTESSVCCCARSPAPWSRSVPGAAEASVGADPHPCPVPGLCSTRFQPLHVFPDATPSTPLEFGLPGGFQGDEDKTQSAYGPHDSTGGPTQTPLRSPWVPVLYMATAMGSGLAAPHTAAIALQGSALPRAAVHSIACSGAPLLLAKGCKSLDLSILISRFHVFIALHKPNPQEGV